MVIQVHSQLSFTHQCPLVSSLSIEAAGKQLEMDKIPVRYVTS